MLINECERSCQIFGIELETDKVLQHDPRSIICGMISIFPPEAKRTYVAFLTD